VVGTSEPAVDDGSEPAAQDRSDPGHRTPWWKETLLLVGTALILALVIKTFFVQAFYIPSGSMEKTLEVNDRILVQKVSYWFGDPQRGDIVVFDDPANWLGEEDGSTPSNPVTKALSFVGLYPSGGHLVKRVIGIGGDEVRCRDGIVQVNGVNLKEAFTTLGLDRVCSVPQAENPPSARVAERVGMALTRNVTIPANGCLGTWDVKVPADHLWVLGDNRENSADSRAHMGDPGGGFIPVNDVVGKVFVTVWPVDRWRFFHRPPTFGNPALNTAMGLVGDTVPLSAFLVLAPTLYRRATVGDEMARRPASDSR